MSDINYETVELQASYGVGLQLGQQLAANPFDGLVIEAVQAGLIDAFEGNPHVVEQEQLNEAFKVISQRIQEAKAKKVKAMAGEGEAFLAENAKRDAVQLTTSGLQYEVLQAGSGPTPSATSTVRVHYHGSFVDGRVFDSSLERGVPAEFPVNGVIKGWTEALQMMPVGSKWKLFIPHQLAYGERGAGGAIPPYSALVFEVELLEIL